MPIWIWLVTFLKGFLPIDGKRIGKILWVLGICVVALGIYHKLFVAKAESTNIETIENYVVNQCTEENKAVGVKINLWKLKLSLGI